MNPPAPLPPLLQLEALGPADGTRTAPAAGEEGCAEVVVDLHHLSVSEAKVKDCEGAAAKGVGHGHGEGKEVRTFSLSSSPFSLPPFLPLCPIVP